MSLGATRHGAARGGAARENRKARRVNVILSPFFPKGKQNTDLLVYFDTFKTWKAYSTTRNPIENT